MIIFRYISKELYTSLLGILIVLLIVFISNQFIHYLQFVASGHITMSAVMKLMSIQVPFLMGYLLPLSLYLSILLVFGRLYLDHEMTVMSACGMSPANFLMIILSFALTITMIVAILMLWLQPLLDSYRTQIYYESVAQATIEKVMPKRFQELGPNAVFYAEELDRGQHKMRDVFFAQHNKSWDITVAKIAQEKTLDNNDRFLLFKNGYRYLGSPGTPDYQVIQYQEYGVLITKEIQTRSGWPSNASTNKLWRQRKNPKAAAELHWRMAMPVSVLVLALLAFPLSRVNPRRGKFTQLLPAILFYIVYGNLLFLGKAWIIKGIINFNLGLWWVHGIMLLITLSLLYYRRVKNAYS